mmetsp:Transcript_25504/g.60704  ORF Transcript_25504/g.60704 Transcript_25504/m.60704 type:complete len:94 (+) Transcript_25504:481-762(+)
MIRLAWAGASSALEKVGISHSHVTRRRRRGARCSTPNDVRLAEARPKPSIDCITDVRHDQAAELGEARDGAHMSTCKSSVRCLLLLIDKLRAV